MIDIYIFTVNNELIDIAEQMSSLLPKDIENQIKSIKISKRKSIKIITKILLWKILVINGFDETIIQNIFSLNNHKPFINYPFYFNLSHSEDKIVITTSKHQKVGIDIEFNRYSNISIKDYSPLIKFNEYMKYLPFYDAWVVIESILKTIGTGFSKSITDVFILEIRNNKILSKINGKLFFSHLMPLEKYSLCLTSNTPIKKICFYNLQLKLCEKAKISKKIISLDDLIINKMSR